MAACDELYPGVRPRHAVPQLRRHVRRPSARGHGTGASTPSARVDTTTTERHRPNQSIAAVNDDLDDRGASATRHDGAAGDNGGADVTSAPAVDPGGVSRRRRWSRPDSAPILPSTPSPSPATTARWRPATNCGAGPSPTAPTATSGTRAPVASRRTPEPGAPTPSGRSGIDVDGHVPESTSPDDNDSRAARRPGRQPFPGRQHRLESPTRRSSPPGSATIRRSTSSPGRASTATCRRATTCSISAPIGSDYRTYGDTCAGRQATGTFNYCHVVFPQALVADLRRRRSDALAR